MDNRRPGHRHLPMNPTISSPTQAIPTAGMPSRSSGRLTRWVVLLSVTAMVAAVVAQCSGGATYVERLLDIVAKQGLSSAAYDSADESPELKAIFLDAASNPELTFKMQLALAKYPQDARKVLETFAGDPMFREVLTGYGERIVPVIGYFQRHDVATLRASHRASALLQSAKTAANDMFRREDAAATPPAPEYGPSTVDSLRSRRRNRKATGSWPSSPSTARGLHIGTRRTVRSRSLATSSQAECETSRRSMTSASR